MNLHTAYLLKKYVFETPDIKYFVIPNHNIKEKNQRIYVCQLDFCVYHQCKHNIKCINMAIIG